ncbi:MAG: hypothetical protein ACLTK0_01085 [Anaerovoracaceae bacterium]
MVEANRDHKRWTRILLMTENGSQQLPASDDQVFQPAISHTQYYADHQQASLMETGPPKEDVENQDKQLL